MLLPFSLCMDVLLRLNDDKQGGNSGIVHEHWKASSWRTKVLCHQAFEARLNVEWPNGECARGLLNSSGKLEAVVVMVSEEARSGIHM